MDFMADAQAGAEGEDGLVGESQTIVEEADEPGRGHG
jgi:hypothetical protein